MRAGKKMGKVHIISTSKEMTGTGRLIHRSETGELISGKLLGPMQATRCRMITQFWVLIGINIFSDVELIYIYTGYACYHQSDMLFQTSNCLSFIMFKDISVVVKLLLSMI